MILVDTNILIDIFQNDPHWAERSMEALASAAERDEIAIDEIIYAELAAGFGDRRALDDALGPLALAWTTISRDALALAGRTFRRYRREGGVKNNVLADFFIGAHASVDRHAILTRDQARYKTYFPETTLLSP